MSPRKSRLRLRLLYGAAAAATRSHGLKYIPTYVETGVVEPYHRGRSEIVWLQGELQPFISADDSTSRAGARDGTVNRTDVGGASQTIRLTGFSDVQTSKDVLTAELSSDDAFRLAPLDDCWSARLKEAECCTDPPNLACFNMHMMTSERCCVLARAGKAFLALQAGGIAMRAAKKLLPRYNLNETLHLERRLNNRVGTQPSKCSTVIPSLKTGIFAAGSWPDFGMHAAFQVLARHGVARRRALHIGANDGRDVDPLYPLIMNEELEGLGLEADANMVNLSRRHLPGRFRVEQAFVTPSNIRAWSVPLGPLDIVVVDIDSFECDVIEGVLDATRHRPTEGPALLYFEINTMFPPPYKFCRHFGDGRARLGRTTMQIATSSCSLSYAVARFDEYGYDLLTFNYDAMFVRRDLRPLYEAAWGVQFPQDEFECYRNAHVHSVGVPLRIIREWFFRSHDPFDLRVTFDLMHANISIWSQFEPVGLLPWELSL